MSVAEAAHRPDHRGRALSLWIGFILLIGAGVALAWVGTNSVRKRTVQVDTVQAGSGPTIGPQDGVLIEYEGRLTDGKVFDSSAGKGPIPLIASQVIPGFADALSRMQEGGSYKIHIPSKLASGANPPEGAPIPPNADLDYDVKVVKVVPNAALMQGSGQAPPPQEQAPEQPGEQPHR
jgi:FKBP-type peptidyl-prolyl cis-trans isomerase FkpA